MQKEFFIELYAEMWKSSHRTICNCLFCPHLEGCAGPTRGLGFALPYDHSHALIAGAIVSPMGFERVHLGHVLINGSWEKRRKVNGRRVRES